jgi:K+-sensing histidine kinase KdpD/CheY-like chemotaxis protein
LRRTVVESMSGRVSEQFMRGRVRSAKWKVYTVAVLAAMAGFAARVVFWPVLGDRIPLLTFFPAIVLSSWYGGLRGGVANVLLAALAIDWLFLAPRGSLAINNAGDLIGLVLFVFMGIFVSWLTSERGRAIERLFSANAAERMARHSAESAARRMAHLQEITAAVSGAATRVEVAQVVLSHTLPVVGATSGVVALLSPDRAELVPIGTAGAKSPERPISIQSPCALADAVQRGQLVIRDISESDAHALWPGQGTDVALPVLVHDEVLAAICWRLSAPRSLADDELAFLQALGAACAQALERSRLYEDAERLRLEAEAANHAKDDFLAMLGHELRNPLSPMVTALELIRIRGGGQLGRAEAVIARQVQHLSRMVDDLLDVARVARGMVSLSQQPCESQPILERALAMASPLIETRRHHVRISVPRTGLIISADQDRLAQVFANLLINSAKFTEPGGRLDLSAAREGADVTVRVKDNGVGMSPELLTRIFEPFVQEAQGPDRRAGGLGIGLSLAKSLVAMHGGSIEARSEGPGRGSELIVRLPALAEERVEQAEPPSVRAQAPLPAYRVLVVDDNEDAAESLAEVLRIEGWRVAVAHDGPMALSMLDELKPDVAILDIGLPIMDGYELAKRIRERLGPRAPRLIAVTGYGQERDRTASRAAGFERHLVKPVCTEDIRAVLAEA